MTAKRNKQGAAHNRANAPTNEAPYLIYTPRTDATPEAEVRALASVYRFLLFGRPEYNKAAKTESEGEDAGGKHT